jgi:hypothetical protein
MIFIENIVAKENHICLEDVSFSPLCLTGER